MGGEPREASQQEKDGRRIWRLLPILIIVISNLVVMTASGALPLPGPLNDLFALGQGGGQTPAKVAIQKPAEPPQTATPLVKCRAGDKTNPSPVDGRVPNGSPPSGFYCNLDQVAHQGNTGGFKTLRYVDEAGHTCAFYDTALLFPINALKLDSNGLGVAVLDMSDPAHPKQTDMLTAPPMESPHESVALNQKRGLLAAVEGNPTAYPGLVSIYDASADCRHPVEQSTLPLARLGHESGFSEDGKTFYATAVSYNVITAIDVTDPKNPHDVWQGNISSHGMSLSDDGNRAYLADTSGNMTILDTSEIQARKSDPQAREISRLTWNNASIPQNAIPFTRNGHPYILEFDEYTAGTTSGGDKDAVGAGRIIDISDETHPYVVSNLRLAVDQHDNHAAAANDPGASSPVQGYAAHYCNIPSRVDPQIVACSFIASGLRVFDISDLVHPKEIAYFVAPSTPRMENRFDGSNFAMSQPVFAPGREIWYTDGGSGFYNLRVDASVYPGAKQKLAPARCAGRKATIRGTSGKDKLKGTKKRDVISAGRGKDKLKGRKGNDLICGGKGKDRLAGGRGKDKLLGGDGNDKISGGAGRDRLNGGRGRHDRLKGGPGKDVAKQ
jgi:hemolysin type calcium-binding protein/LVIVD repeat-containing protein